MKNLYTINYVEYIITYYNNNHVRFNITVAIIAFNKLIISCLTKRITYSNIKVLLFECLKRSLYINHL